jgi:preprotein translocase subunit YajC
MLILLPLFAALIYLLFIRPQQRQVRQHKELIESLQVGDEILTASGIYGTITELDGEDMKVEVAEGVEMAMARRAVAEVAVDEPAVDEEEIDLDVDEASLDRGDGDADA